MGRGPEAQGTLRRKRIAKKGAETRRSPLLFGAGGGIPIVDKGDGQFCLSKAKCPCQGIQKKRHGKAVSLLAAGEGFEPSHTESESAVLPLHNPAMSRRTKTIIQVLRCLSTVFFFGALFSAGPMGGGQAARRSAEVKYFFSGLYSRANTTTHRMMLGSI